MIKGNRKLMSFIHLLLSLLLALLLGGVLFLASGYSPFSAYKAIFQGAIGSPGAIMTSLSQATPLIFTGLAFVVALKGGVLNIGAEGQLYAGAFAAAIAGAYINGLPSWLHISVCLGAAIIAGGLWGVLISILKIYFGSQEVITSIMLNYIMTNLTSYFVNFPFKAPGSIGQTILIQESAILPSINNKYQLTIAIVIAAVTTILMHFIYKHSALGYEMEVLGKNPETAKVAGINTNRLNIITMFISGGIAGLAGASLILGVSLRFIDGFSSGYGFEGIAVSSLAAGSILGILISAFFFGALRAGAMTVNRVAKIPFDFIIVIQAMVIIFVAAPKIVQSMLAIINKKHKGNTGGGEIGRFNNGTR